MKILVVDDTKNIRMLLSTCLQLYGYEVITANDGQSAFNLITSEKLDLIFLDIKLPGISGTEVLRRIRALGVLTPIVIMTAFATVRNAIECTKLGAVAYLQKPFTADKVKNVINEIINCSFNEEQNIESNLQIAKELINTGEIDEAFLILKKQLSLNPANGEIYLLLGLIYEKKLNYIESKRFYNIAKQFEL
jgi:DNA-binding response OmpR family regulator